MYFQNKLFHYVLLSNWFQLDLCLLLFIGSPWPGAPARQHVNLQEMDQLTLTHNHFLAIFTHVPPHVFPQCRSDSPKHAASCLIIIIP